MAKATKSPKSENGKVGMGNASTGPRTPEGKEKSSQNAVTHGIFVGRILPDEYEDAFVLFAEFQLALRPRDSIELEIIGDMVLNRLQKRRLDKFSQHQSLIAHMRFHGNRLEERERRVAETFSPPAQAGPAAPKYLAAPLELRVQLLTRLRARVAERGPKPDEDLEALRTIYGAQLSLPGSTLVCLYDSLKKEEKAPEGAVKKPAKDQKDSKAIILMVLDTELQWQNGKFAMEQKMDEVVYAPEIPVLPSGPTLDLIERYQAANERQFMRCLQMLESVRRLGSLPADGRARGPSGRARPALLGMSDGP